MGCANSRDPIVHTQDCLPCNDVRDLSASPQSEYAPQPERQRLAIDDPLEQRLGAQ